MSRPLKEFEKDPAATLDYTIDWTDWLASGDELSTASWTVDSGLTLSTDSNTAQKTTAWLSGGTHGRSYCASVNITTCSAPPRIDERCIVLLIREQ